MDKITVQFDGVCPDKAADDEAESQGHDYAWEVDCNHYGPDLEVERVDDGECFVESRYYTFHSET